MPEVPVTDKSDHDILIEVATNLNGLCKQLKTLDSDNKADHKTIRELIDSNYKLTTGSETRISEAKSKQVQACNARFLPQKIFLWIAGFIILGVFGSYGFTTYVQRDLTKHKVEDARIMSDFINHLKEYRLHKGVRNDSISTTDKTKRSRN